MYFYISYFSYDKGIEQAMVACLKIFTNRPDCEFEKKYYALVYRGIIKCIELSNHMMDVVLVNSTEFLLLELPGSRIMTSAYIYAIEQVLTISQSGKQTLPFIVSSPEKLRLACYKILNYFFGIRSIYINEPIHEIKTVQLTKMASIQSFRDVLLCGKLILVKRVSRYFT